MYEIVCSQDATLTQQLPQRSVPRANLASSGPNRLALHPKQQLLLPPYADITIVLHRVWQHSSHEVLPVKTFKEYPKATMLVGQVHLPRTPSVEATQPEYQEIRALHLCIAKLHCTCILLPSIWARLAHSFHTVTAEPFEARLNKTIAQQHLHRHMATLIIHQPRAIP